MKGEKPIPAEGDLEFRLKYEYNPTVKLDDGQSALYIGSGEDIGKVTHLLELVDAPKYILSDLNFKGSKKVSFADSDVTMTNIDGYQILRTDDSIFFIMIDQAAEQGFQDSFNHIRNGAIIYTHTIDDHHQMFQSFFKERIGLEKIGRNLAFSKKIRDATKEDFFIAKRIYEMLKSPLNFVAYLQDNELPQELIDEYKARYGDSINEEIKEGFASHYLEIEISIANSRYQKLTLDAMMKHGKSASLIEPPTPKSKASGEWLNIEEIDSPIYKESDHYYDSEQMIKDAHFMLNTIEEYSIKFTANERFLLRERLEKTYNTLDNRDIEYHNKIKPIIKTCLSKL